MKIRYIWNQNMIIIWLAINLHSSTYIETLNILEPFIAFEVIIVTRILILKKSEILYIKKANEKICKRAKCELFEKNEWENKVGWYFNWILKTLHFNRNSVELNIKLNILKKFYYEIQKKMINPLFSPPKSTTDTGISQSSMLLLKLTKTRLKKTTLMRRNWK